MKIDGYFNAVFFLIILVFSLGMASLGAKKGPTSILGYTPTPTLFRFPTLPPGAPTATLPPGVPTATLPPGVPTNTPVPPTATTAPVLPTLTPTSPPCPAQPNQTYASGGVSPGPDTSRLDDTRRDLNLSILTLNPVNETKGIITYPTDPNPDPGTPPQFFTLLRRVPTFLDVYRVAEELNPQYPVHVASFQTNPGETIYTPQSSYFPGGNPQGQAFILYARTPNLTLVYTNADNVQIGYMISMSGICVHPSLQQLYESLRSTRNPLPVVSRDQILGVTQTTQLKVGIRDSGSLMDPRARQSWWQGY